MKTGTRKQPEGGESLPGNDITRKSDHERRHGTPYRRNHHGLEAKEEEGGGEREMRETERRRLEDEREREEQEEKKEYADKYLLI